MANLALSKKCDVWVHGRCAKKEEGVFNSGKRFSGKQCI